MFGFPGIAILPYIDHVPSRLRQPVWIIHQQALAADDRTRIRRAYNLLYGRSPTKDETKTGVRYFKTGPTAWTGYAHVLLASTAFSSVNLGAAQCRIGRRQRSASTVS